MAVLMAKTVPGMALPADDAADALAKGQILADRYQVLSRIADGGMGSVYVGRQLGLDRRVAIKTLLAELKDDRNAAALFRREAMAVKQLTHPNTVRLYDFGEAETGQLYLVMEYLEGRSLDQVLRREGPLALPITLQIGRQVLKCLIEAHAMGVVHRDIKPSNLMLCRQLGESTFVKVFDFGVALSASDDAHPLSARARMVGTPIYMSPEQVCGQPVDGRSDLYSLGITLYELSVGKPPYQGDNPAQIVQHHLSQERLPLPEWLQGTEFGRLLRRATAKAPENRFQTAAEMLEGLDSCDIIGTVRDAMAEVVPFQWYTEVDATTPEPGALTVIGPSERTTLPSTPKDHADNVLVSETQISALLEFRLKDRLRLRIARSAVAVLLLAFVLAILIMLMPVTIA